ncbi:hypothetical protein H4R23_001440, partial [Coemansia sp. Cherry 401B]
GIAAVPILSTMGEHVERMGGDAYAKVYALYNIAFSVSSIIVPTIMPPIMNAVGFAATMGIIASILPADGNLVSSNRIPASDEEAADIHAEGQCTTKVWFNLLNTIIGSGVLCLPYALHNAGFVFGLLMLGVIAVLSQFSLYVLVLTGKRTGTSHFSSVTEAALGNFGYHLLNYSMIIDMVGTVTLYLMIVGDMVTALANIYLPVASFGMWVMVLGTYNISRDK